MFGEKQGTFGRRLNAGDASMSQTFGGDATRRKESAGDKEPTPAREAEGAVAIVPPFQARAPRFRLVDVVLPEGTRRKVERLTASIRNYDQLAIWAPVVFDRERRYLAVNFYGPPGTGKTMCAEALAAEFDRPILEVNYAELESELWGKSSKNIQLAFRSAKEQNAILFFDEADSVLGSRIKDPGHSSDQHVNLSRSVLLKELDNFSGIVMFATNLAKNYDRAFVRRIFQHIEVPLPDRDGRRAIWQRMLTTATPGHNELDWELLAEASEGLAGGDIANAIRQVLPDVHDRVAEERKVRCDDLTRAINEVRQSRLDVGD